MTAVKYDLGNDDVSKNVYDSTLAWMKKDDGVSKSIGIVQTSLEAACHGAEIAVKSFGKILLDNKQIQQISASAEKLDICRGFLKIPYFFSHDLSEYFSTLGDWWAGSGSYENSTKLVHKTFKPQVIPSITVLGHISINDRCIW